MKISKILLITGIVAIALSSCQKQPVYPNYPVITFKSFTSYGPDSAHIVVNFTDGNGELGYPSNDQNQPPTIYYEWMYLPKDSTTFIPYISISGKGDTSYSILPYNISSLTPTGKDKGISGEIQLKLSNTTGLSGDSTWYAPFPIYTDAPSIIEFKVWVVDRNGIKSNVVTSTPFTVPN
jgi:hypothetical protein